MGESGDHFQQQQPHQTASRLGSRITGGEIVEVQGGHIVRSIGRKDRHSKVCTAKGTRDRRVRLSAHTAIQFYDVQDRLGYDRPSKAVDWLINKAKNAIDELAELPAWNPTTNLAESSKLSQEQPQKRRAEHHENQDLHPPEQLGIHQSDVMLDGNAAAPSSKRAMTMLPNECKPQGLQQNASFLSPSLGSGSGSVSDTIKSFFPMGASPEGNSSRTQFQGFPPPEFLSRTSSQSQDLRLTLQSLQDPISLRHLVPQTEHQGSTNLTEPQANFQAHALYSGANHLGYEMSGWSEHQQPAEIGLFQRLNAWSSGGDGSSRGGAAGPYLLNSQPMQVPFLLGQNKVFSQRGPLQSSISPSIRAWMDPSMLAIATADHSIHQDQHHQAIHPNYPSISAIRSTSGLGGFSGSRVPARIQGEGEEHDGFSDNPSSASSDSLHRV